MTDDLSRSARQFLGELRATQAYVRTTAARALPYASMMRVERIASDRCATLLDQLGVVPGGPMPVAEPVVQRPPPQTVAADQPMPVKTAPRMTDERGTAPSPAPRVVTPPPAPPTPPRLGRHPSQAETKPPAPRGRTIDLDDQLTVASPPPSPRPKPPAPRGPTPMPAPRAATPAPSSTVSPSPPRLGPREQAPPTTGSLVSFDTSEPSDPPTVIYGRDGVVEPEPEIPVVDAPASAESEPEPEPEPEPATPAAEIAVASTEVELALDNTPAGPTQTRTNAPATSGLYGGAVPSVRGADAMRPRAAAIQLNSTGTGGRVLLDEEDEPIEVGEAPEHELADSEGDGFTVALHEDEAPLVETPEPAPQPEPEPAFVEEPPPTEEELTSLLSQAQSVASTGNLHGAAQLYSDVIDMSPEHARAHVCRGRLYLDLGDYSRAMSDFMVAEDLAPDDPETHVAIGDLYFHRKDYRRAIDYFSSAIEVAPEHAMAFCRRGICHYYRKNFRVALEDLLRAQDLQPDIPNITAYVTRARKKAAARRA